MPQGRVHSCESFGSADGPGVRYLIFLQGCAMRCAYCHNPDTWNTNAGELRGADELLDEAERYRSYWGEDGGITVSGGEPLLQIDFLVELFQKAREHGINTCIDTALAPFTHDQPFLGEFEELMGLTDLLLCDIKHIDPTEHRHLTGHDNANILSGLRYLSKIGKPVWIRHVLVPGITDNDDYLRRTATFIHTLSNVERVEVLPQDMLDVYYGKGEVRCGCLPMESVLERLLCKRRKLGIFPQTEGSLNSLAYSQGLGETQGLLKKAARCLRRQGARVPKGRRCN